MLSTTSAPALVLPPGPIGIVVPGIGPGIAGEVTVGPVTPVCVAGVPCDRPYDGAIAQILDATSRAVVGTAVANARGRFIVSVPAGDYLVHIMTIDFPRCPEVAVTVGKAAFSLTQVTCDTGLR
jgi:hypothetical protein